VGVTAFLRLLTALVFMFLLLRRQRLGEGAALCGALAYGLCGFLLIWLGWPIVNAAALLPVALYAVARCDEAGGRADRLLLWLALFALLASGHPEVSLYAGALTGAFFLARLLRRPPGARARFLAQGAVVAALAIGAAAPAWLPMLDYLPQSERAAVLKATLGRRGGEELRAELADPEARAAWRELVTERWLPIAAPNAYGSNRRGLYWGEVNSQDNSTGFAGTATLLLALAGLAGARRFPQERLMLGTLAVGLLLLAQPPGLAALVYRLPLVGATAAHHNRRLLLLVAFSLCYLAACTVERLRRGDRVPSWPALLTWTLFLALLLAWGYVAHEHPYDPWLLAAFRRHWLWGQLAALAFAAAVLLAGRGRRWTPAALAAVIAVELLAAHGPENPPMPKRLAFPVTAPIAFLQRSLAPGERMVALGPAFQPNVPSLYGFADVRFYNPVTPIAYRQLTRPLARTPDWVIPEFARPRHPLYDLLGVRFVLTRPGVRYGPPLRRVLAHPAGWIYERRRPLPRLFLPAAAAVYPEQYWDVWLARNPDFRRRAVVDRGPDPWPVWRAARPRASRLAVLDVQPARLTARARLAEPRLLASSVYQDGHWIVLLDGRRLPSVRADGPFVGAWLPRGKHQLELLYRPRAFLAGCALMALSLALLAAWLLPPPGREGGDGDRRKQPGAEPG
jgi:hypothetical protein